VTEQGQITEITVDELAARRDGGALVLDVRMPDEYAEAHVPGALLVPLPELPERYGEIPPVNVAGGTLAWLEAGRPAATGSDPG
jgi:rhodanese-related sulfurtransferase